MAVAATHTDAAKDHQARNAERTLVLTRDLIGIRAGSVVAPALDLETGETRQPVDNVVVLRLDDLGRSLTVELRDLPGRFAQAVPEFVPLGAAAAARALQQRSRFRNLHRQQRHAHLADRIEGAEVEQLRKFLHEVIQVLIARDRNIEHAAELGFRQQVNAELRDNPKVRAREDAVDVRSIAIAKTLPKRAGRGQSAHAGAQQIAVTQHHLQAAVSAEMIAIRAAADAVLERVAGRTAPARIRRVDTQLEFVLADVSVQIKIADARLHHAIRTGLVDLEDAVHALEIQHDRAVVDRRAATIGQIASGRDWIEWNAIFIRDPHQRLHLVDRGGRGRRPGAAPPR